MTDPLKVACIQMDGGPDITENLRDAEALISVAESDGALFVLTPELTDMVLPPGTRSVEEAYLEEDHPAVPFFSDVAQRREIWLQIGSIIVKREDGRLVNRGYLFDPHGKIVARYDKIHLFDVDLPTGESHRESKMFAPGTQSVVADIYGAKLGMSICYDLRFAYLYRKMAQDGAQIISVPAAFTVPTGQAHWEVLLRARAIETGSFVMAAAQGGSHRGARKTYGHSMIITPWGKVMEQREEGVGVVMAELHLDEVTKARQAIPALQHDRDFT